MTFERRQAPRHRVGVMASAAGSPVRVIDISSIGVCFETAQTFAIGEYVPMVLPLVEPDNPHIRVRCDARVVRVERHGERSIVGATYEFVPPHLAGPPSGRVM